MADNGLMVTMMSRHESVGLCKIDADVVQFHPIKPLLVCWLVTPLMILVLLLDQIHAAAGGHCLLLSHVKGLANRIGLDYAFVVPYIGAYAPMPSDNPFDFVHGAIRSLAAYIFERDDVRSTIRYELRVMALHMGRHV